MAVPPGLLPGISDIVPLLDAIFGLRDSAGGFFEEFVDEGLVGFGLLGGHTAELAKQPRGDANGDELFCVSRNGAADSPGAAQFGIG